MRKFAIVALSIVVIVIAIPVIVYWISFPTVSYRYRLTVAVEADGQVHSGTSVIEVHTTFYPDFIVGLLNGTQLHSTVTGQAALIDLGPRGALVAALAGQNYDYTTVGARELPGRAFFPSLIQGRSLGIPATLRNERAISRMQGAAQLTPNNMPAFYWFSNPADVASVKEVKPADFAPVIGDSMQLVAAQVEVTRDPIVFDIDKHLPAYATLIAPPNKGIYVTPSGLTLGSGMFIAGSN